MSRRADTLEVTPARAPRTGLLIAARVVDTLGRGVRWGAGLDWLPELAPPSAAGQPFDLIPLGCDVDAPYLGEDEKVAVEKADPFAIRAFDWCSSMDSRFTAGRDWQGRATRLLEATQSRMIAEEFWRGTVSDANPTTVNIWLADGSASSAGAQAKPGKALAYLDAYVADALSNGTGMIHCSPLVLNLLYQAEAIRREGNLWLTATDNIVVADAGYDGGDENETGEWMYASTVPTIVLGPIEVSPLDESSIFVATNDVVVIAQRDVMILHEPHLLHAEIQIDLT